MKHLLSLEQLSRADMEAILAASVPMKRQRGHDASRPLEGQTWALLFAKSSTRTRVSFEVGLRELGANVMFLSAADIQLGRGEPIKDTARVLGRMVHGVVFRTFAQADVEEFARFSGIPTINALTDEEHPCQILTDIFTFQEQRGPIQGKVVTFVGDGSCVVTTSTFVPVIESWSIGDVCALTDLKPHVLRYWESQFKFLSPAKNRSGNRVYQRREIEMIQLVKQLLYAEKYTIDGARQKLDAFRKAGELKSAARVGLDMQTVQSLEAELRDILAILDGEVR